LPSHARMRRSEDFRRAVRHGVRAGRRTVVVHALRAEADVPGGDDPAGQRDAESSVVGFVVAKVVGSAVHRNRVRRRLRHLCRQHLGSLSQPTLVVVRALPPAAAAGVELADDLNAAWTAALAKLERTRVPVRATKPDRR
jgi:ribonuclease P protein component